jgi:hypothetical protein
MSFYSPAREKSLTKRNILAGWAKAGLQPFNQTGCSKIPRSRQPNCTFPRKVR